MRQYVKSGITVCYADEIGFAFMPCVIKASGGGVASIQLTMSCQGKTYTCTSDAFGAGCIMDYREYVQSMFDGDSRGSIDYTLGYDYDNLGKDIQFEVTVYGDTQVTLSFTTFYVWGAMRVGETWGGYKRLTWFTNYPFSFGLFASGKTKILIGFNKAPQKYIDISVKGMFSVMAGTELDKDAGYSIIYSYDGEIKQATFESIFDLTFYMSGGAQKELLRIDYDDTKDGIYLRWIDRHGFYRYWLFSIGDQNREVASDGEFVRNNIWGYSELNPESTFGRNNSYQRKDTVSICAALVDSETFDFLQDLTSSPVVDMYLGGDANAAEDVWQSVTVKSGTYTKTGATLQDFVCQIEINDIYIQKL